MQAFDAAVGGQRKGEDSPSMSKNRASVQAPEPPLAESRSGSRPSLGSRASSVGSWRPSVFDFRSGGTCPTCRGTGRIPQGQDDELVALIPYNDKRLKPRKRYCVYLVIVLVAVLIAGSILLAFMFPRSASITVVAMNSTRDWVPLSNGSAIEIMMETHLHVSNSNFFPIHVSHLIVSLYNINIKVGSSDYTSFSLEAREDAMVVVHQNATFTGQLAERVRSVCTGEGWSHCLYMMAEVDMHYTVLSHKAEAVNSNYYFVSCDFFQGNDSDWTDFSDKCSG